MRTTLIGLTVALMASACNLELASSDNGGSGGEPITREDIASATIKFHDVEQNHNVAYWHYQFDAGGTRVVGCNSNNNSYTATGWTYSSNDSEAVITVYFGSAWEEYTMWWKDDGTGKFTYDNSNGDLNAGRWTPVSTMPCF